MFFKIELFDKEAFSRIVLVVYFDQQMGPPHTIRWSKSFVSMVKQVFWYFSVTNGRKRKESTKIKHAKRGSTFYRRNNRF